jgi:hypothetical protein
MIANALHFETTNTIDYSLTPTEQGWQLMVWESASITETRENPFLWKFRVELVSLDEARSTLRTILGEARH